MLREQPAKTSKENASILQRWFPWTQEEDCQEGAKKPTIASPKPQESSNKPPACRDSGITPGGSDNMPKGATQPENTQAGPTPPPKESPEANPSNLHEMEKQLEFVHMLLAEINTAYSQHAKNEKEIEAIKQNEIHAVHDQILGTDSWFSFVTAPYQLRVGDLHYSINYKTTTGKLDKMVLDEGEKSLTAQIANCPKVGQITLEIPRMLLDSKSGSGSDIPFSVIIQYRQFTHKAIFSELYRNRNARILQIDLPHDPVAFLPHDLRVKITGTQTMHPGNI